MQEIDCNYNPVSVVPNPRMRYSPSVSIIQNLEKWDEFAESDLGKKEEHQRGEEEDSHALRDNTTPTKANVPYDFTENTELLQNHHTIHAAGGSQPQVSPPRRLYSTKRLQVEQQDSCVTFSLVYSSSGISSRRSSCDSTSEGSSNKEEEIDTFEALESVSRKLAAGEVPISRGYVTNVELIPAANTRVQQSTVGYLSTEIYVPLTTDWLPEQLTLHSHHDTTGSSGYGSEYTATFERSTHPLDRELPHIETIQVAGGSMTDNVVHDTTGSSGYGSEYIATSEYAPSERFLPQGVLTDHGEESHTDETEYFVHESECKTTAEGSYISSEHLLFFASETEALRGSTKGLHSGTSDSLCAIINSASSSSFPFKESPVITKCARSCSPQESQTALLNSRTSASQASLPDQRLPTSYLDDCAYACDFKPHSSDEPTARRSTELIALPPALHVGRQRSASPCYRGYVTSESLLLRNAVCGQRPNAELVLSSFFGMDPDELQSSDVPAIMSSSQGTTGTSGYASE